MGLMYVIQYASHTSLSRNTRQRCAGRPTGAALRELVVVLVVAGIAVSLLFLALNRARQIHRQRIDSTQVGGVQRGLTQWASRNHGAYPLPSAVDRDDATVAVGGTAKDTTANIVSLLIYVGELSPEIVVSPLESNTSHILIDPDYMWDSPIRAVRPEDAHWDPAFAADFTNGKIGNTSYAHVLPGGGREALWKDTFAATEPVVGNRGPEVASVNAGGSPTFALAASNTFIIHGSRNSWEGNIAYNDGHVAFETKTNPDGVTYRNAAGKKRSDNLFFEEPDDATGHNAWMSIWTTAGTTKAEFTPIWD